MLDSGYYPRVVGEKAPNKSVTSEIDASQAQNKSKNNVALGRHVGVYMAVLTLTVPWIFPGDLIDHTARWFTFVVVNSILHFCTDYVTSRITSKLYAKQDWHNFFVVVGFDQLIHQVTLAGTMVLMFGGANA
jgi:hypothetical protein